MTFKPERFSEIASNYAEKNIAVVGDLMLDGYFWGDVKRISPEAPVPVVEIDEEFFRFGGAANVVLNLKSLGVTPIPFGVIGDDDEGRIFSKQLQNENITDDGLLISKDRPTTVKIRVIANKQHIVRIDKEQKNNISKEQEKTLFENICSRIGSLDAIILQDYNKGVLTPSLISSIVKIANENNVVITVDPKFINFFEYSDVTVFKPNKKETEDAFNIRISTENEIENALRLLNKKLNAKNILLTLGELGITLLDSNDVVTRIPTKARKVADVSGAGDTVIATLTAALTGGASFSEASYLANYAGGLVCEEMGIVPIDPQKLLLELKEEVQ
jgi:rfaE bifunctional protein kinase chain/domain